MNPVSTILEAILTEPTPNTPAEFTEDQIGYSQTQFMELLRTRLTDRPDAEAMLKRYLEAPDIWETQLAEALTREGIDQDKEIVEAARQVLQYAEPLSPDQEVDTHPDAVEPPSTILGVLEETEDEED